MMMYMVQTRNTNNYYYYNNNNNNNNFNNNNNNNNNFNNNNNNNNFNNVINIINMQRSLQSWKTMFKVHPKYVLIKLLGRGTYGVVCSAINTETNEMVAIKKISNVFANRKTALMVLRELKILRYTRHENVIALKDVMVSSPKSSFNEIYLVYELMHTDLDHLIRSEGPSLSNDHCKYFMFQLLRGLKYLHSADILHRDLKPANLLINKNLDLKIADFGFARTCKNEFQFMTNGVATRWYKPPELLLMGDVYGSSVDMWSVGCIFAEMLGRKPLFKGTDSLDQVKLIIEVLGTQSQEVLNLISQRARNFLEGLPYSAGINLGTLFPQADALAIDLLKKMLVFNPNRRITVSEALRHPYMSDLYVPADNRGALFPIDLDYMQNTSITLEMMRELVWMESMSYHPIQRPHPRYNY